MKCPYCKETIQDEALKCRYCGSFINSSCEVYPDCITTDELRAFIGTNSHYYIQQFSKFNQLGMEKFVPSWNWSCFGFTWLWFLYRKSNFNAMITFVVFCVPGVNIILHVVAGVVGNWLYYKHVKGKISEIRAVQPSSLDINAIFQEVGGVNKWVITVGIVISIGLTILFFFFFATIIASVGEFSGVWI